MVTSENTSADDAHIEKLPLDTSCYTLANGSRVFLIYTRQLKKLYVGRVSEDFLVINLPTNCRIFEFAGRSSNLCYFRALSEDRQTTTVYELNCDNICEPESLVLRTIRTGTKYLYFALDQPYFIDQTAFQSFQSKAKFSMVESFDGRSILKLSDADRKYMQHIDDEEFFVRRNVVYFIRWSGYKKFKIDRYTPRIVILHMESGRCGENKSVLAQDDSLIYILDEKKLIILDDNDRIIQIEMRHEKSKIAGMNNNYLEFYANIHLNWRNSLPSCTIYFSQELGEEHDNLLREMENHLQIENMNSNETDDSVQLDDDVVLYTLNNGSKIYFRNTIGEQELYAGSDKEYTVESLPYFPLVFAGEFDNGLCFYTKLKKDDDSLYTFYRCYFKQPGVQSSITFQMLRNLPPSQTSNPIFLKDQPYYVSKASDGTMIFNRFDHQWSELSASRVKVLGYGDIGSRLIKASGGTFIVKTGPVLGQTKIFEVEGVIVVEVNMGFDLSADLSIPTSVYGDEEGLVYILFGRHLLVIGMSYNFATFEIRYPNCTIGGSHNGRIFLNTDSNVHFSQDLENENPERWRELMTHIVHEANLPPPPESEREDTMLYTLNNGKRIYFRNNMNFNDIYSENRNENLLLPEELLHFAGESNNELYFYNHNEETYSFFKCSIDASDKIIFHFIREVKSISDEKQFLNTQPFFLSGPTKESYSIESFDGRKKVKLSKDDANHIENPDLFGCQLFIRKGIVFYVKPGRLSEIKVGRRSKHLIVIETKIGPHAIPTSIYVHDESLIYLLFDDILHVIGDSLNFVKIKLSYSHSTIGGANNGKIYLNTDRNLHVSQDLGEEFHKLVELEKEHVQEDEGIDTDNNNTTEELVEGDTKHAAIEDEESKLRKILNRLSREKKAREEEIERLTKTVAGLCLARPGRNMPFISKFSKEFDVTDILGIGSSGCVFEAENKFDEYNYAVKRIAVDPINDVIHTALREVRAMAQLDHPGIVRYNSTWIEKPPEGWQYKVDDEKLDKIGSKKRHLLNYKSNSVFIYIQMQLCNYSLTHWLSENDNQESRRLPRMKKWFKQIVSAVEYIHDRNLIHRDLKPCNILFIEKDRLKICDLGVVTERKMVDGVEVALTRTESGTEAYMSPEQAALVVRLTSKSDIFTLGLILVEMCVHMDYKQKVEIFNKFRKGKQSKTFDDERTAKFVEMITDIDKEKRPTCKEMLNDFFLA